MIGRATIALGMVTATCGLAAVVAFGAVPTLAPFHRTTSPAAAPFMPAQPTLVAFAPHDHDVAASHALAPPPYVGSMSYDYTHRLQNGETLGGVLAEVGIGADEARAAIGAMRREVDPRRLRVGQELRITLGLPGFEGGAHEIQRIAFDVEFPYRVVVNRTPEGDFEVLRDERPLERAATEAAGTIRSSLFQAGSDAQVPVAVLAQLLRMFSWDIDFQRDIRRDDRFAVLYDRFVDEEGEPVKSGEVSAAALVIGGRRLMVYRFVAADGTDDVFTADGQSVRKPLLRTPVDGARLSSGFGKRRHPILGYTKMHKGVDFAAPTGTPIFASGDGTVEFVGRRGGYGKYIRIRHRSGYSTAYAHMSRYAADMRAGRSVRQGQIIGYVGSTGRSTGPHLHYEILVDGRHINPLSVRTMPGRRLAGADLERFRAFVAETEPRLAGLIESTSPTIVARAGE